MSSEYFTVIKPNIVSEKEEKNEDKKKEKEVEFVVIKEDDETVPETDRCQTIQLAKYPYYIYTRPMFPDKYIPKGRVNYSKMN